MIITSKHELGEERKDKNTTTDKKRARLVSQAHGAGGCVAGPAGNWATAGAALRPVPSSSSSVPSPGLLRGFFAGDEHPSRYAHPGRDPFSSLTAVETERPNPSFSYLAMDLISSEHKYIHS